MTLKSESKPKDVSHIPVAIVGMACLFPGSPGLKAYWQLLMHGRDAISDIPETHWSTEAYFDADPKKPDHVYCKRGAFLPSVAFDPSEFGIPPSSLEATDTSQLLALVTAKDALGDAGYGSGKAFNRERTSVVLGVTGTQEMVIPLGARLGHPIWREAILNEGVSETVTEKIVESISNAYVPWQENSFPGLLGNVVAGRICNRLDLGGTNCVVDAACASSMSAVHLSLLELQAGRSDMVVTGGVDTINDIFMHMCFSKTMILSKTGDIRPFSRDADGTVLGEGVGMVVLKRLEQAEKDGDHIYAVIKGMGSSSDGRSQSIYAPRAKGQLIALRSAYKNAGVNAGTVELVEAHGTGTRVGDKVELSALKMLYGTDPGKRKTTAIGSVKSMIGHTKAAAGAAGLIKTALALENKVLPPTLKAEIPDPELDIEDSPFYINSSTRPWLPPHGHPRRAAVSSFGFGGSNFHLVLEEYNAKKTAVSWDGSVEIFAFSGQDKTAVSKELARIENHVDDAFVDPTYVNRLAATSRRGFSAGAPCRLVFVQETTGKLKKDINQLNQTIRSAQGLLVGHSHSHDLSKKNKNIFFSDKPKYGKLAFIFPGQGSQYLNMGRDLCCAFPEALNAMALTDATVGADNAISPTVYPCGPGDPATQSRRQKKLSRTDIAQPAICGASLSMFDILQRFGVQPEATCGHSYGELSALHAAGWISRESLMELSVQRGIAMAQASASGAQGTMLAVNASISDIEAIIAAIPEVVLANVNSPQQCVLSGPLTGIENAGELLRARGLRSMRLPVSAAFHSSMIQNAQDTFKKAVQDAEFNFTQIPVFANSSGYPYKGNEEDAKDTLSEQMLQPVNFVAVIENMVAQGVRTFVEVGPKNVLTGLVNSILEGRTFKALAMDASGGKKSGVADLACVLSELACLGYPVRLDQWEDQMAVEKNRRMTVMLNGANYHKRGHVPADRKMNASPESNMPHNKEKPLPLHQETRFQKPTATGKPLSGGMVSPKSERKPMQNKMRNNQQSKIPALKETALKNDALQTITQGLKSMQALQASTAEAHQKFLEIQAEAGRTLQRMMENTQRLAELQMGRSPVISDIPRETDIAALPSAKEVTAFSQQPVVPETSPTLSPLPIAADPVPEALQVSSAKPFEHDPWITSPTAETADHGADMMATTLLDVVSELTGYPVDMLNMDMDIEADLGIDSIKRVEILSSLEERMPDLPGVEPDTMATLKTLGQIAEHLGQTETPASSTSMERLSSVNETLLQQTDLVDKTRLAHALLEVVSELTGYPADMLGMDMDIEADLGIDSIKRVEILSTLEEQIPGLPEVTPDLMSTLKTLDQIAEYLTNSAADSIEQKNEGGQVRAPVSASSALSTDESMPSHATELKGEDNAANLSRKNVIIQETPRSNGTPLMFNAKAPVYIVEDNHGLAGEIAESFKARGVDAVLLTRTIADEILEQKKAMPRAAGLIIAVNAEMASDQASDRFLKKAFMLMQAMCPERMGSRENHTTLLATITRMDGAFGFRGGEVANPAMGGLAGLLKTAAIEWPGTFCRAFDIDPAWNDLKTIAERVSDELLVPDFTESLEIGLAEGHRFTLVLDDVSTPAENHQKVELGEEDVVIVTGGARGITAAAALALGRHTGARMVLMGRSEQPHPEPGWFQGLASPVEIKKAIRENEFNNNGASPMDIERSYTRHMANREMLSTFQQFEKNGVEMRYVPIDIRDSSKVTTAIDDIRTSLGAITAVIHGAGVLEDRLIVEKKTEQLDRVFDTKVMGLRNLFNATRKDTLKHLVVFSSVSARMGNSGQADYAMANETLNKMAVGYARSYPECHVLSINWGPWDGGMVTPSLKKIFQNKGIGLIPLEAGARSMINEMGSPKGKHPIEIVIGSMLPAAALMQSQDKKMVTPAIPPVSQEDQPPLNLTFKKEIDTLEYPILADHVIGGKPVVPFALITEWFGHGALHDNPGLVLHGIDDMRILKGIRLDAQKKLIRLFAGKPSRNNGHYEVSVELRDGVMEGRDVIHSRGRAILTDTIPEAPVVDAACFNFGESYTKSVKAVYEDILFHGVKLHGIKEILTCSSNGMAARVSSAPSPSSWIKDHLRSGWIADPLVLDCAFQMATVWCYEETGNVSLPSYCASYRQYCTSFPTEGITALLEVTDLSDHKMTGNFMLVDKDNRLAAQMTGYEAILDSSLFKAFKPIGK